MKIETPIEFVPILGLDKWLHIYKLKDTEW